MYKTNHDYTYYSLRLIVVLNSVNDGLCVGFSISNIRFTFLNMSIFSSKVRNKTTYVYFNDSGYSTETYTLQATNILPWVLGPTQWSATMAVDYLVTEKADITKPNQAVLFDGKLMTKAQMEQEVNSNDEEWIARFGLDMKIPGYDLSWANKV